MNHSGGAIQKGIKKSAPKSAGDRRNVAKPRLSWIFLLSADGGTLRGVSLRGDFIKKERSEERSFIL